MALRYPGSRWIIGRKNISDLKATTQAEYLEEVVAPDTIDTFLANENILYYKNGAVVHFEELKTPSNFKSWQIAGALIDEADENDSWEIVKILNQRMRQKIKIDGRFVPVPYCLALLFNPVPPNHWIHDLASKPGWDLENFRFDTYDNRVNLPPGYIEDLEQTLDPIEIPAMIHGHWGVIMKGRPVIHGWHDINNVRPLKVNESYPLLCGWDFGFNHPSVCFSQQEALTGRYLKLREMLGVKEYLPDFTKRFKDMHRSLVAEGYPTFHYGDPHGIDKKDVGESSIEYLRNHHQIHVAFKRGVVRTGLDEIQGKIIGRAPYTDQYTEQEVPDIPLFLVDPSCTVTRSAYAGGYHRGDDGKPLKDGYYDHVVDNDRYVIVNNMNSHLAHQKRRRFRYKTRNRYTGY